MLREDMSGGTVYKWTSTGYFYYPVLILRPQRQVYANETVGTRDAAGNRLQVSYIRGTRPKSPGMLGIVWNDGDNEEKAARLSELATLDQDDLLKSHLGKHLLPKNAVAKVVYPRHIESTWANWKAREHERTRPRAPAELALEAAQEQRVAEENALEDAITESIEAPVRKVFEHFGADVDIETWWTDTDAGALKSLDVTVTIKLEELVKVLPVEVPQIVSDYWGRE